MKLFNKSILLNLGIMFAIALTGFFVIVWGLDAYTNHGETVTIPSLKGKPLEQAISILDDNDLRYEVVDSVYDKNAVPGTIIEVYPNEGENVKPRRIVFLKIYASQPPRVAIPPIKNMSARQAYALLKGMGFENITQKSVPGEYIGMCQGITLANGQLVQAGDMLSKDTHLVLLVTGEVQIDSISIDDLLMEDSLAAEGSMLRKRDSTDLRRRRAEEPLNPNNAPGSPTEEPENWW